MDIKRVKIGSNPPDEINVIIDGGLHNHISGSTLFDGHGTFDLRMLSMQLIKSYG